MRMKADVGRLRVMVSNLRSLADSIDETADELEAVRLSAIARLDLALTDAEARKQETFDRLEGTINTSQPKEW